MLFHTLASQIVFVRIYYAATQTFHAGRIRIKQHTALTTACLG